MYGHIKPSLFTELRTTLCCHSEQMSQLEFMM